MKMKKFLLISLIAFFLFGNFNDIYGAVDTSSIVTYAPSILVIDSNTNKVLYEKNSIERLFPASTTKIMTALLALENGDLNDVITMSEDGREKRRRMTITAFIDAQGRIHASGDICKLPEWGRLHRAIVFNCSAEWSSRKRAVGGNATDRALLEFAGARPVTHRLKRGKVTPFRSDTKYMATEVSGEINALLLKGAPEVVLKKCGNYDAVKVDAAMKRLQEDGARLIAVSENASLLGIFAIRDDVRREAADGVRQLQEAGIQTVMITGDAKETAGVIARRVGLGDGRVLTSAELAQMSDADVRDILPRLRVVARALPGDKSRLVKLAQASGLVAGMTGDGVNDAPALRRADIGFAMGSGTEVAKEAGDIVILDDNLLSVARAVRYGRTIFKSIRKFVIFQLTLNVCAVGLAVIAPLLGFETPITVIQMLWINMVMDTLAGLAFGGEPPLRQYMKEPPKKRDEPIINRYMRSEILLGGAYAVALCLWFLKSRAAAALFPDTNEHLTAFFALFMFIGISSAVCARTHRFNKLDHLAANKPFLGVMGLVAATQTLLVYRGGALFRTVGLSAGQLVFVLLLSSTVILAHMLRLNVYERKGAPGGT